MPLTPVDDLAAWLERTPPEIMAVAFLRLAALAAGWYLAVCTLALALSRPFPRTRVAAAAARATPVVVRRIVSGGGSLGLAAGTLLGALPTATMATSALAPTPAVALPAAPMQDPGPATATMTRSPRDTPLAVMTRVPAEHSPPARAPGPDAAPAPPPSSWTVEAGESFWSIASEAVAPAGDEPNDRQVIGYWRRLVQANHGRLLDPGNPDLLVPGQELLLPDPAG